MIIKDDILILLFICVVLTSCNLKAAKDNTCPNQPTGTLDQTNVKSISLSGQESIQSGQINSNQNQGYIFTAKTGQKLAWQTKENLCVWIFTPSNKLLKSNDLPEDGKYTIQLSFLNGATSFNLAMKLEDEFESLTSSPSKSTQQNIINSPIQTPSSLVIREVLDVDAAKEVILNLYSHLSNKAWSDAINLHTSEVSFLFDPNFFKQFDKVTVEKLSIASRSDNFINFVGTNTYFYPDGSIQMEERSYTVQLINNIPLISASNFLRVIKSR